MGMTRSPGWKRVTEGPVLRTEPAQSELGGGMLVFFEDFGIGHDGELILCGWIYAGRQRPGINVRLYGLTLPSTR